MVLHVRWWWAFGLAILAAAIVSAREEVDDVWIRGVFTGHSPRAQSMSDAEASQEAARVVEQNPGSFMLVGTGRSMQPLYPAGTVLVLREVPYDELRPGQTAIYRNQQQRAVGHILIAKARDGWRAKGLNNRTHDSEAVRADNLIGVVIAAFRPTQAVATAAHANARRPAGRAVFLSDR